MESEFIHHKAHFYLMNLADKMSERHKITDCALMEQLIVECMDTQKCEFGALRCVTIVQTGSVCLLKSGKKKLFGQNLKSNGV